MWLPDSVKIIAGIILLVIYGLTHVARRRARAARQRHLEWLATQPPAVRAAFGENHQPDIGPLRAFNLPELPPELKERQRRRSNFYAGAEFILLGLVIPIGYGVLEVMFMSDTTLLEVVLVGLASLACIVLGIVAIVSNR